MKKILIVDDDKDAQYLLSHYIRIYFACKIVTANNGQEALDTINKEAPDVIILDVAMPIMDGMSMMKILRSQKNNSNIPVIVLSAVDEKNVFLKFSALGIVDYLIKPINMYNVCQKLEQVIGVKRTANNSVK
jgi:CheY-like chemotaxis protein